MKIIQKLKAFRHKLCLAYYHCLPIQSNKIITWNSTFRGYGDSPKYISEYLCKNAPGQYDIVWVYDRTKTMPADLPDGVRAVPYFSLAYLKELSTARVILSNIRTSSLHFFKKRRGQYYIQTWHSSVRLKKIEADAADTLGADYICSAKEDSAKCDLILSGCDFSTRIFEQSFWYTGKILKSGTPRCDILLDHSSSARNTVLQTFRLAETCRLVLYAPTFRDCGENELHDIPAEEIVSSLQQAFGGNWIFLYRLHPNLEKTVEKPSPDSIDATSYPDMQELLAASDVLITDYSSCMFDMAFCRKPCFLFAPDLDYYSSHERGLYFDIHTLPFPIAQSAGELLSCIQKFDASGYQTELDAFIRRIGSYEDGKACERITEEIHRICYGEN